MPEKGLPMSEASGGTGGLQLAAKNILMGLVGYFRGAAFRLILQECAA